MAQCLLPRLIAPARCSFGQILARHLRAFTGYLDQILIGNRLIEADDPPECARCAKDSDQGPRIDSFNGWNAMIGQPGAKLLSRP